MSPVTIETKRPQLAHLSAQLDDLRARGTYFRLRVLDDEQGPVVPRFVPEPPQR